MTDRSFPVRERATRQTLLALFVLLFPYMVGAQPDSLLRVLHTLPHDRSRLPVLNELFQIEVYERPDSALAYARAYQAIARTSNDLRFLAVAESMLGQASMVKGHDAEALPHFLQALTLYEQLGDERSTPMLHANIATVHASAKRWERARREYIRAIEGFEATGQGIWSAGVLSSLADTYHALGMRDSAVACYERSALSMDRTGLSEHAAETRAAEAGVLLEQGLEAQAIALYRDAFADQDLSTDAIVRTRILLRMGIHATEQAQYDRADSALRTALRFAEMGSFDMERSRTYLALSELDQLRGRPDSAIVHLRFHMLWNDSLRSLRNAALIAEAQERYDSARKDAELAQGNAVIARQRLQIGLGAAAFILLVGAGAVLLRIRRNERRQARQLQRKNSVIEQALKDKDLLLREVHHRVKNNLQIVGGLLRMQGRSIQDPAAREAVRDSQDRVRSMALIHQGLYQVDDTGGIDMAGYVEKLARGLLQSHGIDPSRITIRVEVPTLCLDVDTAIPIGLILNELILNALKHAFPAERQGTICVSLHLRSDGLHLSVGDDGIGMPDDIAPYQAPTGFGTGMLRTFAEKLQAEHHVENRNGTAVSMRIRNYKLAN
ncbi:MAG: tetratricopeptide repeat protein [Flavobacteriales bacterium]|nr:tetratricopeptide repeat protein [Flavobacteriales bacterium]MBL0035325.1 tetratricopeptide repeat protein [Flavobacteriales bacterium]